MNIIDKILVKNFYTLNFTKDGDLFVLKNEKYSFEFCCGGVLGVINKHFKTSFTHKDIKDICK